MDEYETLLEGFKSIALGKGDSNISPAVMNSISDANMEDMEDLLPEDMESSANNTKTSHDTSGESINTNPLGTHDINGEASSLFVEKTDEAFTPQELLALNIEMKSLDMEIASIAAVALESEKFEGGKDMLEHFLKNSKTVISELEKNITKIIIGKEINEIDKEDKGRKLDHIYEDKRNIDETLGKVSLFSNGELQRLDEMELLTGSPIVSTVSFFNEKDILDKMRISPSLFSPVLALYHEVFDWDDDFQEIIAPYSAFPIYSDDILKDL